jgi:uncharacterized membrane protein (DUF485 family)
VAGLREHHVAEAIDWDVAVQDPVFKQLVSSRQRFVLSASLGAFGWLVLWLILIAYAPDFMGSSIYQGFTLAYAMGLSQYLLVWVLSWWYLRKSKREWGPLRQRVIERMQLDGGDTR